MESGGEVSSCRVCYLTTEEPLLHPCKCVGTLKFIHESCWNRWSDARPDSRNCCEVCKHEMKSEKIEVSSGTVTWKILLTACYQYILIFYLVLLCLGLSYLTVPFVRFISHIVMLAPSFAFGFGIELAFIVTYSKWDILMPLPIVWCGHVDAKRIRDVDAKKIVRSVLHIVGGTSAIVGQIKVVMYVLDKYDDFATVTQKANINFPAYGVLNSLENEPIMFDQLMTVMDGFIITSCFVLIWIIYSYNDMINQPLEQTCAHYARNLGTASIITEIVVFHSHPSVRDYHYKAPFLEKLAIYSVANLLTTRPLREFYARLCRHYGCQQELSKKFHKNFILEGVSQNLCIFFFVGGPMCIDSIFELNVFTSFHSKPCVLHIINDYSAGKTMYDFVLVWAKLEFAINSVACIYPLDQIASKISSYMHGSRFLKDRSTNQLMIFDAIVFICPFALLTNGYYYCLHYVGSYLLVSFGFVDEAQYGIILGFLLCRLMKTTFEDINTVAPKVAACIPLTLCQFILGEPLNFTLFWTLYNTAERLTVLKLRQIDVAVKMIPYLATGLFNAVLLFNFLSLHLAVNLFSLALAMVLCTLCFDPVYDRLREEYGEIETHLANYHPAVPVVTVWEKYKKYSIVTFMTGMWSNEKGSQLN